MFNLIKKLTGSNVPTAFTNTYLIDIKKQNNSVVTVLYFEYCDVQ